MTAFPRTLRIPFTYAAIASFVTLAGCTSTPRHTNTLIFGTTTRVALDVSQDLTSGVGVTVGYKRQEAVWMPLVPNQQGSSDLVPANCADEDSCPKFEGKDKDGQKDTYSVLASFGAQFDGGASAGTSNSASAKGGIAQYFATGLAARLLAQKGGAGLVNTQAENLSAEQKATLDEGSRRAVSEIEQLVVIVSSADRKTIDTTKLNAAFAKKPGSSITVGAQTDLKAASSPDDLRSRLSAYRNDKVARPMLETLSN